MVRRTSMLRACMWLARAQWLFGDSLPTNRQVGIRDLFDFFWSVEQGHINCRRVYVLDFRPVKSIRPGATSTAVEWIYLYGPGAVHRPVRDRGWWRCKSSRVPGLSGSASTTSSRRAGCRVAQVRIHPSQRRPLARPCAHTDCRFRLSRSCRPSPGYCMGHCLGRAWALLPPQSLLDVPALAAAALSQRFPSVAW